MRCRVSTGRPSGYIALLTAIVISAVLLAVAVTFSAGQFYTRFNVADVEYKQRSTALAEACLDVTLLKLSQNPAYVPAGGGDSINVGADTCIILAVVTAGGQTTIQARATFQQAVTNLQIIVDSVTQALVWWEELPTL